MSREVFVDTSAWIAVSDRNDKYHRDATQEYRKLIGENLVLVTTNLVIAETYILIRRTGGHAQAMQLLRSLKASPRLKKVWSDTSLEARAEEILEKYNDQDFSYTDAVSFAVMQEREIDTAFTFDRHFASMQFQIIPSR